LISFVPHHNSDYPLLQSENLDTFCWRSPKDQTVCHYRVEVWI